MAYCYLIKKHTIVSFHDLSHVSQGSFSRPSSPWLASNSDRQIVEGEIFQNYGGKVVTYYKEKFFSKSWILCHMASTSIAQCKQTKKIWTCNIRSHELKWFCPKKCIEFMVVQCIDRSYNYVYSLQFHVIFWLIWNVP